MNTDQHLILAAISAYIVSSLALFVYMLSRQKWAKTLGVPFAVAGCAVQFFELVYRCQTSHIWPLTNLYGSLSLFSAMSVVIFIGFAIRYDVWFIGGLVQMIAAGFLAYALTWDEGYLPAVPALQSYWIKVHVPLVVTSYAAFMVAFASGLLYLVKYYGERLLARCSAGKTSTLESTISAIPQSDTGDDIRVIGSSRESSVLQTAAAQGDHFARWLITLPPLSKLDILCYRIIAVGLPLLTVGIITGAWWAKEAWGAYWQWDPKETAALFSWIVYASYMHLHTRNAWRGVRSAWLVSFGFVTIIFCYLGVNIWISGLHSYKM
jgi:cytochrome c-type biogenesis protein CcsB